MASTTILILFLTVSAAIARSISEKGSSSACSKRRVLTQEEVKNFVYDPDNEEAGPYFEGDIEGDLPHDMYDRNGIIGDQYRWPDNTLVYSIEDNFTEQQLEYIKEAHRKINKATDDCIKFREKTNDDKGYAAIINSEHSCTSKIGYRGERQEIKLADGCFHGNGWGSVAHEHIHALGFYHEQSREDRDDYVSIVWENIKDGHEYNFCKHKSYAYKEDYDYDSIMHYNALEFSIDSKNQLQTIVPRKRIATIGQRERISKIDAIKIKKMYGCE